MGGFLSRAVIGVAMAAATILAVATLVFFGMQMIEGTYEELFFPLASPEQRAEIAAARGLDGSQWDRYVAWLSHAVRGDFGTSLVTGRPVIDELAARLPLTLQLGLIAIGFILLIALPLGLLAGVFFRSRLSQTGRLGGMALMSLPDFVLGSFVLWFFSRQDLWLRAGGWQPLSEGLLPNLQHALLPGFVLAATGIGIVLATTRSAAMQTLAQDHVLAAVSRGVPSGRLVRRHVVRNAMVPVMTMGGIVAGYLLGGAVIVETVFTLDGVGRFIVSSIAARDYPVVQAGVIFVAGVFVIINLIIDLMYALVDPRIGARG